MIYLPDIDMDWYLPCWLISVGTAYIVKKCEKSKKKIYVKLLLFI